MPGTGLSTPGLYHEWVGDMKSERRHELEHNELADWIGKTILAIKPYQNLILGVLILLLVGGVVFAWWRNHSGTQTAEAWDQFCKALDSRDPAKLNEIIEQYPNTHVAHCAALVVADMHLNMGCERRFENNALASQELIKATKLYKVVLDPREGSRNALLREQATFGLARAYEASGDLDKAVEYYQQVKGAYAAQAQSRLNDLAKHSTKEWYDRFARFDPKPFEEQPSGKFPKSGLEIFPEEPGEYEPGKTFDLKGKGAKQLEGFPKPSTEPETTKPSTEPEKPKPSTEPEPTKPSTEPETTKPSAEPETPRPGDPSLPKDKS